MISSFDTADIKTNSCARAMKLKFIEVRRGTAPQGKLHREFSWFSGFVWFVIWFDLTTFTHFHAFSINKNKERTAGGADPYYDMVSNNYNHWFLFISLPCCLFDVAFCFFTQETPPNQQTSPVSLDRFRLQKFICSRCGADVDTIADWLRIDQVTPHDMRRRTGFSDVGLALRCTCMVEISNIFWNFHPDFWGNGPMWRASFSNGVKAPTSTPMVYLVDI